MSGREGERIRFCKYRIEWGFGVEEEDREGGKVRGVGREGRVMV